MNPQVKNSSYARGVVSLTALGFCLSFSQAYAETGINAPKHQLSLQSPDITAQRPVALTPIKEPTTQLVLAQALALALTGNPELAAFSGEIRAREAATLQASLMPNPVFNAKALNFGNNAFKDFDGDTVRLQLSQLIELGGKRAARTKAATLNQELADWDYESKRIDILTQTTQTFIGVLTAQKRLTLQQQLLKLSTQVLDTAIAQVKAGNVSPLEETKARVAEASSRVELMRAQRKLITARQQLAATWGSEKSQFTSVVGDLDSIDEPPTLESLFQRVQRNPDLARWVTEITRRQAVIAREKSKAIPNVNLSLGLVQKMIPGDTAIIVGFSVPLQLFDRNQGKIQEAEQRLSKAMDVRRNVKVRIATALNTVYQQLDTAYVTVTTLRQEVIPGAESAFKAASRGYRLGKFGFLDVLDAQRTLFRVKAQYLQALSDYHQSVNRTERLIGSPLQVPQESASK